MRVGDFGYAILEGKLEIGSGGAEPLFQSGWYYTYFVRDKLERYPQSNSPCLIILQVYFIKSLMRLTFTKIRSIGAHIGFAGAVWTDRPHLEILSCPTYVLPLIRYPHEEPDRSLLVRREESYPRSGGVLPTRYSYSKRSGINCSVSTHIQFSFRIHRHPFI